MVDDPHIVHVIPNESGGGAERLVTDLQSGLAEMGLSCERVHFCGLPIQGSPVTRFGYRHDSLRNALRLRLLLKDRIRRERKSIILHSHLTHGFYISYLARLGLPVKWVNTEHGTTSRLHEIGILRVFARKLYQRCDRIIAISNGVRDALSVAFKLPTERIVVVYNGVRLLGFIERPALQKNPIKIISVGSLQYHKGFDVILRALSSANIGAWEYTIVGAGPELSKLRELAQGLGLSERVVFTGWQDPTRFYRSADLQLIPSRWEGFGLVAAEGMSTGLRVVASDVDGMREVIGFNPAVGRLVSGHLSPENWIRPLEAVVAEMREHGVTSSHASAARAGHFTIQRMLEQHATLYREL